MSVDVSHYRRVAEQMAGKPGAINNSAAAWMMLQLCGLFEERWISVNDRLPERNEIVLAFDQGGVTVGSYSPMLEDWWTLHADRMAPGAVVSHWQPLPSPPEGQP